MNIGLDARRCSLVSRELGLATQIDLGELVDLCPGGSYQFPISFLIGFKAHSKTLGRHKHWVDGEILKFFLNVRLA